MPHVCEPDLPRGSGEDCVVDGQCQSGACTGVTLRLCALGGADCLTAEDCPLDAEQEPTACLTVGSSPAECN